VEIQELISRGRFIFSGAPKRLEVFKFVNGKSSSKEIARKTGRSSSSVLNDIKIMKDYGLVNPKLDESGTPLKKDASIIYEKVALVRHIPISYFQGTDKVQKKIVKEGEIQKRVKTTRHRPLSMPSPIGILDICRHGEDQIYEFKDSRVEIAKISKEIAAFLHTKNGGILFYGIGDDGSVVGSDLRRQDFDQALQNSIRNTISPQPCIEIKECEVMGHRIILVIVPPWDRKSLYQYTDGRFYIRRGTNVFVVTPSDLKRLSKGEFIV
jgi:hypothetical protein